MISEATGTLYRIGADHASSLRQATLPLPLGGLGYTSAYAIREAAFAGSWAVAWPTIRDRVRPLAQLDLNASTLPSVAELRAALRRHDDERKRLAGLWAEWDAAPAAVSRRGKKLFRFHPPGLPESTPSIADIAAAPQPVPRVQGALTAVTHQAAWLDLYHQRLAGGRASAAHFISVSQKHSGAWLQAVPAAPDLRMASDAFEIAVQRRLRAPIAALAGATRSRVLNRDVDKYGDAHQNVHAHGARHNKPLQKFLQCFRAVFGHAVRMEDRYHSGYSPTVRPDLTHLKGAPDGTHHSLYELKVTSPLALSEGGTGTLGGRVGFGNTAEEQYEIILGTPPNAADGSPGRRGVYDDALRGGHRVCPLVLETFGGFHPDAARLVETLARKHGARLGADELSAPWNARSFRTLHLQRISVALQLAAAEEILDTILLDRGAAVRDGCAQ